MISSKKAICMALAFYCLSGNIFAQNITMKMSNVTVKQAMDELKDKSGYTFVFSSSDLNTKKKISVNAEEKDVNDIVKQIINGQNVSYEISGKNIIIRSISKKNIVQQTQTIKGTVVDSEGLSVIGASVFIKGTTTGTITDLDGNFSLDVPKGTTIIVSYIGYKTQEIIIESQQKLNITLEPDVEVLEEVVVTALGIKRATKALGYSVQELKGNSLTEARESNIMNSLAGKLAGVQVSGSGNGGMGSSRILIRGNNSLGGNNEPLVIVDGIPINNFNGGQNNSEWGGSDNGNGLSDINPDDIESISVLKGAAAAALYGTRAGNGVIMVITKTGGDHAKKLGVTLNSNVMFERPLIKPEMQNVYGQGTNGIYDVDGNYSWGPKMDGKNIEDWTGMNRPYTPYDNDITDYLRTGITTSHTLEASAASEKSSFRGTVSYERMDGVVPSNKNDKYIFNIRNTVNLSKNLSIDTKVNYVKQDRKNTPFLTAHPSSVMANYLMMPRSVHYSDLKDPLNADGSVKQWTSKEVNYILNPYFTSNNSNSNIRDRFLGFISLQYKPFEWLTIKFRHGEDMFWQKSNQRIAAATPYSKEYFGHGNYSIGSSNFRERNTDALISAAKDNWWGSKFSGTLSIGGNMMYMNTETMTENSGPLAIPDFFAISNGSNQTMSHHISEKAVNSIYGFTQLSYDNWGYLDITARNDWSSTLPKHNRSFFYPSVGLGWVVSDMLKSYNINIPKWLSFAKLRFSYAEVGNDTDPYRLTTTYGIFNVTSNIKGAEVNKTIPLSDLKPENIKSSEAGFDIRFLNGRLGIDFTWYKKNAKNQILTLPISSTTGKAYRLINAGNIQNKGIEIVLSATPIQIKDFQWDLTINFAKNKNKIIKLHPELSTYELASTSFAKVVAREGGSYGDIIGYRYKRDDEGNKIIDSDGLPILETNMNTDNPIGNYLPDWTGSMNNMFRFKNISLGFMLDYRKGGDVYMNSLARGSLYGTTKMTLEGRDEWYAGTGGIVVDGVTENGEKNTKAVNPQEYWSRVSRAGEEFIYDGTSLRLRELTLGYTLPKKILNKTPFTNVKFSFVGRNLWLIKSHIPGYDPECSFSTGNGQGIEYASFPSMRNFGFNLNLAF